MTVERVCGADTAFAAAHGSPKTSPRCCGSGRASDWTHGSPPHARARWRNCADSRRDCCSTKAAVRAGLTLEWSNGQTEGQVNRLKTLKRQMYGRAGFVLLRQRLLHGRLIITAIAEDP